MFPLFMLLAINMLYTKSKTGIKINFNDVFKENNSYCVKPKLTSLNNKITEPFSYNCSHKSKTQ